MGPNPIIWLITTVIEVFLFLIFARVVLSWLVAFEVVNLRNQAAYMIYDTLDKLTEPALSRVRRYLPNLQVDISPLVVGFALLFVLYSLEYYF